MSKSIPITIQREGHDGPIPQGAPLQLTEDHSLAVVQAAVLVYIQDTFEAGELPNLKNLSIENLVDSGVQIHVHESWEESDDVKERNALTLKKGKEKGFSKEECRRLKELQGPGKTELGVTPNLAASDLSVRADREEELKAILNSERQLEFSVYIPKSFGLLSVAEEAIRPGPISIGLTAAGSVVLVASLATLLGWASTAGAGVSAGLAALVTSNAAGVVGLATVAAVMLVAVVVAAIMMGIKHPPVRKTGNSSYRLLARTETVEDKIETWAEGLDTIDGTFNGDGKLPDCFKVQDM